MAEFLDQVVFGNTVTDWLRALAVGLGAMAFFRLVAWRIVRRIEVLAKRTDTNLDDIAAAILKRTHILFLVVLALWAATRAVELPDSVSRVFSLRFSLSPVCG